MAHHANDQEFNPVDPHGQHGAIHHHVYSWQFLTGVLIALLFFTFLTIIVSDMESWLVNSIAITIPDYVNVLIAMFIATIKASLVVLFFMGLRRGNPINGMIFLFTLFAFAMFLGFTGLDLLNRGHVYEYRGSQIVEGGTGKAIVPRAVGSEITGPITAAARQNEIDRIMAEGTEHHPGPKTEAEAIAIWEEHYHAGHGDHGHHDEVSTANKHVHRSGRTHGIFDLTPAAHDDGHAGHAASDHHEDSHSNDHAETDGHPAPEQPAQEPGTEPHGEPAPH